MLLQLKAHLLEITTIIQIVTEKYLLLTELTEEIQTFFNFNKNQR